MKIETVTDELQDAIEQMHQAATDGNHEEARLWHDKARISLARTYLALTGTDLDELPDDPS